MVGNYRFLRRKWFFMWVSKGGDTEERKMDHNYDVNCQLATVFLSNFPSGKTHVLIFHGYFYV